MASAAGSSSLQTASARRARTAAESGAAGTAEVAKNGGKDIETGDRDPDGRLAWHFEQRKSPVGQADRPPPETGQDHAASDVRGRALDWTG